MIIDRRSRRFAFDLADPDGPKKVYGYYLVGTRAGSSTDHWTIIDKDGKSFLDVDQRDWDPADFRKLAAAAELEVEPAFGETSSLIVPSHRPDHVNVSEVGGGDFKILGVFGVVVPILLVIGIVGLFSGFPWLWPLLLFGLGAWRLTDTVLDALAVQSNRPYLPVDEGGLGLTAGQPAPPVNVARAIRKRKVPQRAALWLAFAVVPPVFAALR